MDNIILQKYITDCHVLCLYFEQMASHSHVNFVLCTVCSFAALENGIPSNTSSRVLKSGSICPGEAIRNWQNSLNMRFSLVLKYDVWPEMQYWQ